MLGKWLVDQLINEQQIKNIIVIYPGRFQPMGKHHADVYNKLANIFGRSNTYIATSDKVDLPKSPLNFQEKSLVIKNHGITNVVQVKNPYQSTEITSKYDPETTAVLFAVGKKDMMDDPRFRVGFKKDGSPSYFQYYDDNKNNLLPYTQHGYLYVAPHVSLNVPGFGEMSGTILRQALATATPDEFKTIMGFFDPGVYNLLKKKFSVLATEHTNKQAIPSLTKEWWQQIIRENLLKEGGASGHMAHPFDDRDLTFGEMKDIIRLSLEGKLDVDSAVTEKTDGQNLNVTFKDGKVGAARNKETIRNPLDVQSLERKFADRGEITKAFSYAMRDLEQAIMAIPAEKREEIFQNGTRFLNVEIIYPGTKNVINYGNAAYLQFHGLNEFDLDTAQKTDTLPEYGTLLQSLIADVNADVQKHFKIIPPKKLMIARSIDFEQLEPAFISQVTNLQNEFNLKDTDEVIKYHEQWWRREVEKMFPTLSTEAQNGLIRRWAYDDKTFRLNATTIPDANALDLAKKYDTQDFTAQNKKNVSQFEDIFLKLGAEVLSNVSNFLAVNPSDSIRELRSDIAKTIKQLKSSTDLSALSKLKRELRRVETIGGFDKIVPSEGLVFMYKGKMYKLTGLFAPINQLLGLTRYSR